DEMPADQGEKEGPRKNDGFGLLHFLHVSSENLEEGLSRKRLRHSHIRKVKNQDRDRRVVEHPRPEADERPRAGRFVAWRDGEYCRERLSRGQGGISDLIGMGIDRFGFGYRRRDASKGRFSGIPRLAALAQHFE